MTNDRFDELVGDIEDPVERERLRRIHELLLSVEAPPERRRPRRRPLPSLRRSRSCRGGAASRWP